MTISQSKADLHASLVAANLSTTDNWDVLVSYSDVKLNALLNKYWGEKMSGTQIKFTWSSGNREWDYNVSFVLDLDRPGLEFCTTSNKAGALLRFPFTGTAHTVLRDGSDKGTETIPAGLFTLEAQIPLTAVTGESEGSIPRKTSNDRISFDDNIQALYRLVVHFENEDATWKVEVKDPNSPQAGALKDSVDKIKSQFKDNTKTKGFDFHLAQVTNKVKTGSVFLRPQEFRFNTIPGVLSIFIRTQGGKGNGTWDAPQFLLAHKSGISPIPEGFEASIILSKSLLRDGYLIPQLEKHGWRATAAESDVGPSIAVNLGSDDKKLYHRSFDRFSNPIRVTVFGNFDKHPIKLVISDNEKGFVPQYQWQWDGSLSVMSQTTLNKGGWAPPEWSKIYGKIENKETTPFGSLHKDSLKFELAFNDSHQPNIGFERVYDFATDKVKFPTFQFTMDDLDFFTTQNIFFHDRHIIKASDMMCPCDCFILGKMGRILD